MWMTEGNTCDVTGHVTRSWSAAGGPAGISHTPCPPVGVLPHLLNLEAWAWCLEPRRPPAGEPKRSTGGRGGTGKGDPEEAGGCAWPDRRRHDRSRLTPLPSPTLAPHLLKVLAPATPSGPEGTTDHLTHTVYPPLPHTHSSPPYPDHISHRASPLAPP